MIRPNKSLGQHFLVNQGVIDRIALWVKQLASVEPNHQVCEIGPGPGALTQELLKLGLKVSAVEIDTRMLALLREKFAAELESGQFRLIAADATQIRPATLSDDPNLRWVVCGNLPYNVGSQIIFNFLENFSAASRFCFMLQKEVVLRFIAECGAGKDYGALSVKMAWATRALGHFWVKPGSFQPPPKVDSGVFAFERRQGPDLKLDPLVRGAAYDRAAQFVSRLFQQRRKMIRGQVPALASTPHGSRRPEELTPEEWYQVAAEHG